MGQKRSSARGQRAARHRGVVQSVGLLLATVAGLVPVGAAFSAAPGGSSLEPDSVLPPLVSVEPVSASPLAVASPIAVVASDRELDSAIKASVNGVRARAGLKPLHVSSTLNASSRHHSRVMIRLGYFAHRSPDGGPFWRRIARFYRPSAKTWSVGENILWATPDLSSDQAVEAWLLSPAHRANILSSVWRDVGISAIAVLGAPGVFGYRPVTVVTMDFGIRR